MLNSPLSRKSRRSPGGRRPLGMESLERRELLAGNVLVQVTGGSVTVTGDDAANNVAIYQQPNGRFNIIAKDGEVITGPTTNLNIRNLTVNVGGGDDFVRVAVHTEDFLPLEPAQILGVTTVNGGTGSNRIFVLVNGREVGDRILPAMAIHLDSTPTSGEDRMAPFLDDEIHVNNSSAAIITMRGGAGNDEVGAFGTQALNLTIDAGPQTTSGGMTDDDLVTMLGVVALNMTASMGGGTNRIDAFNNLFGAASVTTGNGADRVWMGLTVVATNFTVNTAGGADDIELLDLHVGINAQTPALIEELPVPVNQIPFDLLRLIRGGPTLPGMMSISTGDGNDVVQANNLTSTLAIYFYLDGGNDQLRASAIDSTIAFFFGGLGTDGRLITDVDALTELELQFENVLPPAVPG